MQNFKLKRLGNFEKYHESFIFFLKFSENNKYLFSGGKDKKLKIFNLKTHSVVSELPFCDNIFWALEYHSLKTSYIFVIGRNQKITRKFKIKGELKEKMQGRLIKL